MKARSGSALTQERNFLLRRDSMRRRAAARELDLLIMAGALTPSEIMAASASRADFVKVFPCGSLGGRIYPALRGRFRRFRSCQRAE